LAVRSEFGMVKERKGWGTRTLALCVGGCCVRMALFLCDDDVFADS